MYDLVIQNLRTAYDAKVQERTNARPEAWKLNERTHFLARLQHENKRTLLEIGAGPGRDSLFFQENGLLITCTDLSPAMVDECRRKGLNAHVMDFTNLRFEPASFDAIFAQNCLLHVPRADFPGILAKLSALLAVDGLFFLGQYGGVDQEGVWAKDHYEPKRFFSRYLDEQITAIVGRYFEIVDFHRVLLADESTGHFQSFTLRRR